MHEELTSDQVELLRGELEVLKLDLETRLAESAGSAKPVELDQTSVGRVSRMDAIQSQAMAVATRHTLKTTLAQCQGALHAVTRGEYGLCKKCEEPIGIKRLTARPEAPFCLECQSGLDRR